MRKGQLCADMHHVAIQLVILYHNTIVSMSNPPMADLRLKSLVSTFYENSKFISYKGSRLDHTY